MKAGHAQHLRVLDGAIGYNDPVVRARATDAGWEKGYPIRVDATSKHVNGEIGYLHIGRAYCTDKRANIGVADHLATKTVYRAKRSGTSTGTFQVGIRRYDHWTAD